MLEALVDAALLPLGSEAVFTTDDLAGFASRHGGGWPSPRQLKLIGKRLIIFNDAPEAHRPRSMFSMGDPTWGWPSLAGFDGPPGCMGHGPRRTSAAAARVSPDATFFRVQGDGTAYPLIGKAQDLVQLDQYSAPKVRFHSPPPPPTPPPTLPVPKTGKQCRAATSLLRSQVLACGMWPLFDRLDPVMAASTRFAWDDDAPLRLPDSVAVGHQRCTAIIGQTAGSSYWDMRWTIVPCRAAAGRRCACRSNTDGLAWQLSEDDDCPGAVCESGDGPDCHTACAAQGGTYAVPRSAAEMHPLSVVARQATAAGLTIWLNAVER